MTKIVLGSLLALCASAVLAQGYDDPFTKEINEGSIGSGYDDPFTKEINEGSIGSGYDDPFTKEINEGEGVIVTLRQHRRSAQRQQ